MENMARSYKGYFLGRNVHGYVLASPVYPYLPPLKMPFRDLADARHAIDRLYKGDLRPQTHWPLSWCFEAREVSEPAAGQGTT